MQCSSKKSIFAKTFWLQKPQSLLKNMGCGFDTSADVFMRSYQALHVREKKYICISHNQKYSSFSARLSEQ